MTFKLLYNDQEIRTGGFVGIKTTVYKVLDVGLSDDGALVIDLYDPLTSAKCFKTARELGLAIREVTE